MGLVCTKPSVCWSRGAQCAQAHPPVLMSFTGHSLEPALPHLTARLQGVMDSSHAGDISRSTLFPILAQPVSALVTHRAEFSALASLSCTSFPAQEHSVNAANIKEELEEHRKRKERRKARKQLREKHERKRAEETEMSGCLRRYSHRLELCDHENKPRRTTVCFRRSVSLLFSICTALHAFFACSDFSSLTLYPPSSLCAVSLPCARSQMDAMLSLPAR